MQRKKDGSIEWLEFDLLSDFPRLKHHLFLRNGGVSQAPYTSLNVGFQVGDSNADVKANLSLIQNKLKQEIPGWKRYTSSLASHGTTFKHVMEDSVEELFQYDGLTTSTPFVTLMLRHADCQIALIYDPKKHASAIVHAGWRGSAANIYALAIKYMQNKIGSNPADLLVCISPSLGPEKSEFIHYRTELPEELWTYQIKPAFFDFWAISEFQLVSAGILPHHIEIARLCTFTNPRDFFSHRRDKLSGRHAACITLL